MVPQRIFNDARWAGNFGIARYAQETSARFNTLKLNHLFSKLHPLSPVGLLDWQVKATKSLIPSDSYLYSPSFTPALGFSKKQIITVHDLIHLDFEAEASAFKTGFYDQVVKPVVKNSPVTFTVSQYSKQRICEWAQVSPSKVVVTGNAASSQFSASGSKKNFGFPYLLYVGNTKVHKNVEILFEALRIISSDLHLVIVGDLTTSQRQLIAQQNIQGRVHEVSNLSEAELAEYYRGAESFVMPSLYEGFGIPLLESMACGVPVISSTSASLPEVGQDAALYFDPKDSEELASAVDMISSDAELRTKMIHKGLERSREYSWNYIAEKIEQKLLEI